VIPPDAAPAVRPDGAAAGDLEDVTRTMATAFRLLGADPATGNPLAPAADPTEAVDGLPSPARRIRTGHETVGEDLLKLVLTVVELLRQLIERQALRRVEAGGLTDEQEEELGATLMALHERMTRLCAEHGFTLDDLNLDLGPLGTLLPREGPTGLPREGPAGR
jgi:hypothetical protein